MNSKVLKKYIRNIYKLEASIYAQKLLYNKIQDKIIDLKNYDEKEKILKILLKRANSKLRYS